MVAVAMMGLGYGSCDAVQASGLDIETVHALRARHHATIKAVRLAPDKARAYLVQLQRDSAIIRGFTLSHSPDITPRDLRQVASTAAILAKTLPVDDGSQAAKQDKPPPAPTRPQ